MKKEDVESLIVEIKEALKKKTVEDDTIYPWDDVFESMLEYPDRVTVNDSKGQTESWQNDNVIETIGKCPTCGHHTVDLFFKSPAWTWEHLCGRAGQITICPHCGKQLTEHGWKIIS